MRYDEEDLKDLTQTIMDLAERKEWTIHALFEALRTVEFNIRIGAYLEEVGLMKDDENE